MSAPQGTEAWRLDRCGRVTASCFADVMAKGKKGEAATRRTYRMQLVVERLTGVPQEGYRNKAMEYGTETEPLARDAFSEYAGLWVVQTGFVPHAELMAGCSPDGLIEDDAGLEIKCPFNSAVHVETLQNGMPSEHMAQVQGCMWITGRKRWHFVSFDPRMPEHLRLYTEIVPRNDAYIATLETEVRAFLAEVDAAHAALAQRAA
jgi:hypothetical protein